MIRILHVVTYMGIGGLETMLMNYYRHIDRKKIQFDFLVHRSFEADYDREIRQLGGRIYHISRLIPWSIRYRETLKRFFRAHPDYRIVHVHLDCFSSIVLQCAKSCRIPVRIAHSHSAGALRDMKYLLRLYWKKKIPSCATDLLACGQAAGDWMFPGCDFQIMPNAIDLENYRYCRETAGKVREAFRLDDKIVLGHVGRFHPAKNHRFLIRLFAEVVKKEPRARLLLVGDGTLRAQTEALVREAGLAKTVIFAGQRQDVEVLLQGMDLLVFPSLYEGFPVAVVEAQAAGLPCLLSDGVSKECIVEKDLVTVCSLDAPMQTWISCVFSVIKDAEARRESRVESKNAEACEKINDQKYWRESYAEKMETSGYGIREAARKLEQFYTDRWQNIQDSRF